MAGDYDEASDNYLDEINELEKKLDDANEVIGFKVSVISQQKSKIEQLADRCEKLEAYIVRTRGELPGPAALKIKQIEALSKILPDIEAFARSITRGTGSAKNYEYQYRHAEHRAKLTKAVNVQAKKMMSSMIVTVGSIADRTENQVNPEDIHHLREELDKLTANQEIVQHTAVDSYLDGVMPELDLMEGTGKANPDKPIRSKHTGDGKGTTFPVTPGEAEGG